MFDDMLLQSQLLCLLIYGEIKLLSFKKVLYTILNRHLHDELQKKLRKSSVETPILELPEYLRAFKNLVKRISKRKKGK